jgi:hypothetical protein
MMLQREAVPDDQHQQAAHPGGVDSADDAVAYRIGLRS